MKKALIAAAVAGAFAAPSAMAADLQINLDWAYGLQFGEVSTTTAAGVTTTIDTNNVADAGRNRLKFNFTETLDNGVDVHAYMVFNTSGSADGGGNVAVRNANIGFSGDFGTFNVGTNEHFFEADMIIDPTGADYGTSDAISHMSVGQTGFNFSRRDGESVWYTSKDMNGIQLRAAYIMGPQTATVSTADQDGTQIGLSYKTGALFVGVNQAAYNDYNEDGGIVAGSPAVVGSEAKGTSVKVSYDFGTFSVAAGRIMVEQSGISQVLSTADTATALEADSTVLNITMPVAGGKVWIDVNSQGDQDATIAGVTSAVVDSGKSSWDVGYLHDMSAQTWMFIRYTSADTGLNFASTQGSTETDELMLGVTLNY
jgi:hypothetical protein